jgi:hypothetical protein
MGQCLPGPFGSDRDRRSPPQPPGTRRILSIRRLLVSEVSRATQAKLAQ